MGFGGGGDPIGSAIGGVIGSLFGGGAQGGGGGGNVAIPPPPSPPKAQSEQPDATNFGAQPGAAAVPTFLGVNSSMSPLQQRTRVASLATQGNYGGISRPTQGDYAGQGVGDVAQQFYKNVALRSLTDPSGNPLAGAEISPVEWRYVTEVLGQSKQRDTLEHFLTLLTR